MAQSSPPDLSRRERQIMDVIYRRGRATAAEVLEDIPDPPSYSAVRAMLRLLEVYDKAMEIILTRKK
jgi:predicted transcriptional regulator